MGFALISIRRAVLLLSFFMCVSSLPLANEIVFRSFPVSTQNFDRAAPGVYRGGLPTRQDLVQLRNVYQVNTIVDLTFRRNKFEEELARELGMQYVKIPWSGDWYLAFLFDYDSITRKFLAVMDDDKNYPVYVHCKHGRDRTGVMIAAWRMARHQWSFHDAYREMTRYGFNRVSHFTLYGYVKEFSRRAALF